MFFERTTGSKIMPFLLGVLIVATISVVVQSPVEAIVINHNAGASTAIALGSPQTGIVEIFGGGYLASGALIDPFHVITAQHFTYGISPGSMTVNFHDATNTGVTAARSVTAKAEIGDDNLLDGTDIAILTLSEAAPIGFNPLPFLPFDPTGLTADTVGFGYNGLGSTGHGNSRDGKRWAAENVIDSFGAARASGGGAIFGSANILNTDFDDGTTGNNTLSGIGSSATPLTNEGTTAPGDSGGPLLVNGAIVGVLSGGTTATSQYGDISWWTGTSQHLQFIQNNASGAQVIPEPSTFLLFSMAILILVGVVWYRKRKLCD